MGYFGQVVVGRDALEGLFQRERFCDSAGTQCVGLLFVAEHQHRAGLGTGKITEDRRNTKVREDL